MAKHIVNLDLGAFLKRTKNVLLLRNPVDMLSSWADKMGTCDAGREKGERAVCCCTNHTSERFYLHTADASFEETGYADLMALFVAIERETGSPPIVVDSDALKRDPEGVLRDLCARLGIPFYPEQLEWPPGPKVR
jgi:hypothetical protein